MQKTQTEQIDFEAMKERIEKYLTQELGQPIDPKDCIYSYHKNIIQNYIHYLCQVLNRKKTKTVHYHLQAK